MSRLKYEPCPKCRSRGMDSRGDNLVLYPDGSAHCFSCNWHKHAPYAGPSTRRNNTELKEHHGSKSLPLDFTREVDPACWKWLLQWGLPYSYWKPLTGYSPSTKRLVFPVPNSSPVFSIGRHIKEAGGGEHETGEERKWYVWGNCHSHAEVLGNGHYTVLVEDLISGHKVGHITETLPLFGTVVHPSHLYALNDGSNRPIVLWLDEDQRGLVTRKAARLNMLTNRPVYITHTRKDPKGLSLPEIAEHLQGVLND